MDRYSDIIDRTLLAEGLLAKLTPADILDREVWRRVRDAEDAALAGGRVIKDAAAFALVLKRQ